MKTSRLVAATSASLLGLALVATSASAQTAPVSVEFDSNVVGSVSFVATGSECLPERGNFVTLEVVDVEGNPVTNGMMDPDPEPDGTWTVTGTPDITEAGEYRISAFCHFEGEEIDPVEDLAGTSDIFPIVDEDPDDPDDPDPDDPDPDDPDPDDPDPPGGPGDDDDPPTPDEPDVDPDVDEPEDGDDGEDGEDGDDGAPATPASTSPQPAAPAPAVNGEPELTG